MPNNNVDYYTLFLGAVGYSGQACDYLKSVIERYDCNELPERLQEIHKIENAADDQKHIITEKMARDFITPIEREDIMALAAQIDDITDHIEAIVQKLYMFNIKEIQPEAIEFTNILHECCEELCNIFNEFSHFKKSSTISASIIEVNRLEEKGDSLYMSTIHKLYRGNSDAISIMSWTAIYDQFEKCCDACEHTANLVEEVIIKNS